MPILLVEEGEGLAVLQKGRVLDVMLFQFPAPRRFQVVGSGRNPRAPEPRGNWLGAFVLTVDLTALLREERIVITGMVRLSNGGDLRSVFRTELGGGLTDAWQSRPLHSMYGCAFMASIASAAGGEIKLPWHVVQTSGLRETLR